MGWDVQQPWGISGSEGRQRVGARPAWVGGSGSREGHASLSAVDTRVAPVDTRVASSLQDGSAH